MIHTPTRKSFLQWKRTFFRDLSKPINWKHPYILVLYFNDIVWACGHYQESMSTEELYSLRMVGVILRLELAEMQWKEEGAS